MPSMCEGLGLQNKTTKQSKAKKKSQWAKHIALVSVGTELYPEGERTERAVTVSASVGREHRHSYAACSFYDQNP